MCPKRTRHAFIFELWAHRRMHHFSNKQTEPEDDSRLSFRGTLLSPVALGSAGRGSFEVDELPVFCFLFFPSYSDAHAMTIVE